jgi:hypothetical protein
MALLSLQEPERSLRARLLLEEASQLAPASRRAIRKLLAMDKLSPEAIYLAAEVRDAALATTTPARETGEAGEMDETPQTPETPETEAREEAEETEPEEPDETEETHATALPHKALGALAGLVALGLGVLLLLEGARGGGASVAGTIMTSALVGGAAGFLASRRR